jgi:putative membrane protein
MLVAGLALAGIAALVHVYIWVMESFAWTGARARATFGTTVDQAEATRELAFNQGFYNLFLAIVVAAGIVLVAAGHRGVGAALVLAGAGSMAAAGIVLLVSSPAKAASALKQLVPPLLAVVAVVVGLAL